MASAPDRPTIVFRPDVKDWLFSTQIGGNWTVTFERTHDCPCCMCPKKVEVPDEEQVAREHHAPSP